MYGSRKILAVIPARGGSKGVPRKNIKQLVGKPLIAYSIEAAKRSVYVDKVIVTTDSEEIACISEDFGAEIPFIRPVELATDSSRSIDALVHAVTWMRLHAEPFEIVVFLQPTSPLRTGFEIDEAIETFFAHNMLGLASVAEVVENPVLMRRMDDHGILHPLLPIGSTVRRQDMPKFYRVDGAIYINRCDELTCDTSLNDNPIAYVMPKMKSVDIDSFEDFKVAEQNLKELRRFDCCD